MTYERLVTQGCSIEVKSKLEQKSVKFRSLKSSHLLKMAAEKPEHLSNCWTFWCICFGTVFPLPKSIQEHNCVKSGNSDFFDHMEICTIKKYKIN